MKTFLLTLAATATLFLPTGRANEGGPSVKAATVMHGDGSRTDTQTDFDARTSEEKKYDPQGKLKARIAYQLDEEGRPSSGVAYNEKDVELYNFSYTRDALGRISEEKDFSPKGELFQRFVFLFTTDGKVAGVKTYDAEGKLVAETGNAKGKGGRKLQRQQSPR